eukprot:6183051-Pleurochrysis_carterae.AAC.3
MQLKQSLARLQKGQCTCFCAWAPVLVYACVREHTRALAQVRATRCPKRVRGNGGHRLQIRPW